MAHITSHTWRFLFVALLLLIEQSCSLNCTNFNESSICLSHDCCMWNNENGREGCHQIACPTSYPTAAPVLAPTQMPTNQPTLFISSNPSAYPTISPTMQPITSTTVTTTTLTTSNTTVSTNDTNHAVMNPNSGVGEEAVHEGLQHPYVRVCVCVCVFQKIHTHINKCFCIPYFQKLCAQYIFYVFFLCVTSVKPYLSITFHVKTKP